MGAGFVTIFWPVAVPAAVEVVRAMPLLVIVTRPPPAPETTVVVEAAVPPPSAGDMDCASSCTRFWGWTADLNTNWPPSVDDEICRFFVDALLLLLLLLVFSTVASVCISGLYVLEEEGN